MCNSLHPCARWRRRELSIEPLIEWDVLSKEGSSYAPNEAAEKGKRDRSKPPNPNCANRNTYEAANYDPQGLQHDL